MTVYYEWDIEQMDGEEIVDHHFSETLEGFGPALNEVDHQNFVLCLVRNSDRDPFFRSWAYVTPTPHGTWFLDGMFKDSKGVPTMRVPLRFQKELDSTKVGVP